MQICVVIYMKPQLGVWRYKRLTGNFIRWILPPVKLIGSISTLKSQNKVRPRHISRSTKFSCVTQRDMIWRVKIINFYQTKACFYVQFLATCSVYKTAEFEFEIPDFDGFPGVKLRGCSADTKQWRQFVHDVFAYWKFCFRRRPPFTWKRKFSSNGSRVEVLPLKTSSLLRQLSDFWY